MSAASSAYEAAIFSLENVKVPNDGIVEKTADTTLRNLGDLSKTMSNVDGIIVMLIQQRSV